MPGVRCWSFPAGESTASAASGALPALWRNRDAAPMCVATRCQRRCSAAVSAVTLRSATPKTTIRNGPSWHLRPRESAVTLVSQPLFFQNDSVLSASPRPVATLIVPAVSEEKKRLCCKSGGR